jgi:hypothetical protein
MIDAAIGEQSPQRRVAWRPEVTDRRSARHAAPRQSRLPASVVSLSAAIGVLLVAAAYMAGRTGHASSAWADRTYWLGQALIVVPAAIRLLSQKVLTATEIATLITTLTIAEYLVTICYSPAAFTFADELEHWRTTTNILQTGNFSTVNYMLPISPHYPGIEEVTAALVSVTGLPVFISGLIVAGVAHLLFVYALYVFFREISRSYRVGGVAVLCYASNPHFVSFDSMFLYQTQALPFIALTLLAAWHLSSRRATGRRSGWLGFAVLLIAATTVTHHVTSFVLVITLGIVCLTGLLTGDRSTAVWTGLLSLLSAVMVFFWVRFAAPETWGYLRPFVVETLRGVRALVVGGQTRAPPTSTIPLGNKALAAMAVLTVSVLLPVGWWRIRQSYARQAWPVVMAVTAVGWYVVVAIRFTVADGSELAGRAATFIFVPVAYIVALAAAHLAGALRRWQARGVAAAVLVAIPVLILNGLANGWPPYWERLPGPHQVAGAERSVGPEEIAAASWALTALGPGNRFAVDYGNSPVMGSYGDQNPVLDVGFLYTSPVYTPTDAAQAKALAIDYVLVDLRLSQSLPAAGQYFPIDPNSGRYTHPLPPSNLTKFSHVAAIARIYDDGNIVIYSLSRRGNAP